MPGLKYLESLTDQLNKPLVNSKVLHALLDVISDAYWIWEINTGYDYLSAGWQRMLGYSPDELPHHFTTWERLLPEHDYKKAYAAVEAHFKSRGKIPYICDFRMKMKSGDFKMVQARGSVIEWNGDEPIIMAGNLTDINNVCLMRPDCLKAKGLE